MNKKVILSMGLPILIRNVTGERAIIELNGGLFGFPNTSPITKFT